MYKKVNFSPRKLRRQIEKVIIPSWQDLDKEFELVKVAYVLSSPKIRFREIPYIFTNAEQA